MKKEKTGRRKFVKSTVMTAFASYIGMPVVFA